MHLRFFLSEDGKRVYTLKAIQPDGSYTFNAHPARFSPDDQNQKQRFELKKRFDLLPTQQEELKF